MMTNDERNAVIEECAIAAEQQDRAGREWVRDSLWARILKRAGDNVRRLKRQTCSSCRKEAAMERNTLCSGCQEQHNRVVDNLHAQGYLASDMHP